MLFFLLTLLCYADPIADGDRLWANKNYHKAIESWKKAKKSPTQATSIMAQYRLLLQSANIMLPLDLIQADQEMSQCAFDEPKCLLARIDREIVFRTLGFPHNQELVMSLLQNIPEALSEEALLWARGKGGRRTAAARGACGILGLRGCR